MSNVIHFPVIPRPEAFICHDPTSVNFAAQVRMGVIACDEITRRSESPGFFDWFNRIGLKIWRLQYMPTPTEEGSSS